MKRFLTACALVALAAGSAGNSAMSAATTQSATAYPAPLPAPAGAYSLDKAHASLLFRVNHIGFSNFTGRFAHFDVKLYFDPANPTASTVTATIDPRSLETDNPPAGFLDMLHGAKWLNAAQFPQMIFRSSKIELTGTNAARIVGALTFHGVTRPVSLDAKFNGGYAGHPFDPHARIGFSAHGSLKRSAFGIAEGIPAPGTTMGVSDDVEIIIEAEFSGPPLAPASTK